MDAGASPTHPLRAVVDGVRGSLDEAASCPLWSLPDEQLGEVLAELVRERARLDALILDLVRQADVNAVHTATGAASTTVWIRQQTRISRAEAGAAVKLAKALDTTLHATKRALAEGRVSLRHAQEIHLAMGKLPADIDPEVKAQARRPSSNRHRSSTRPSCGHSGSGCIRWWPPTTPTDASANNSRGRSGRPPPAGASTSVPPDPVWAP